MMLKYTGLTGARIASVMLVAILAGTSCRKYLDAPSNKAIVVPSSLEDMQAMLDYNSILNGNEPCLPEVVSDNYYLLNENYNALNLNLRNNYTWNAEAQFDFDWEGLYLLPLYANVILDQLEKIERQPANAQSWNSIRGSALFFRGHAFYNIAQQYCKAYIPATAKADPGIVLKLSSDVNEVSVRSSVEDTYAQMLKDLKQAVNLLPVQTLYATRPNKAAAYGELARICLVMENYKDAADYADSCLLLHGQLMDYNLLNPSLPRPIASFNAEVIFLATTGGTAALSMAAAKVDTLLYRSYDENDLRKQIFFKTNADGSHAFKGTYDGTYSSGSICFTGIATDEMLLIKAECLARLGKAAEAVGVLNTLLVKRWKSGTYVPLVAGSPESALVSVLNERRKELLFRNCRWSDLKRLNKEARFAVTLKRILGNQVYTLPPGDPRYALLIPSKVIAISNIPQNVR